MNWRTCWPPRLLERHSAASSFNKNAPQRSRSQEKKWLSDTATSAGWRITTTAPRQPSVGTTGWPAESELVIEPVAAAHVPLAELLLWHRRYRAS